MLPVGGGAIVNVASVNGFLHPDGLVIDYGAAKAAGIATGRFSTPEEVAALVVVLASPRTANATGSNYVIDGGLVKTM